MQKLFEIYFIALPVHGEADRAHVTFLLVVVVEGGKVLVGELSVGVVACEADHRQARPAAHEVEVLLQPCGGEKVMVGPTCGQHPP